jgi:DnaJ-class molecular chaperone
MNPYLVLGVDNNASDKEIKQAYRKGAIKHHPDKGGDADKFKEVSEAYEMLSSKDKRHQYDTFGTVPIQEGFNPMDLFKMFERDFFGPQNNHPFSGLQSASLSQSGFLNGLQMFGHGPTQGAMSQWSQSIVFQDGKKVTTTTHNGQTTVQEERLDKHTIRR